MPSWSGFSLWHAKRGIRLAFHPNDPPLPVYRGVEQPFTTVESQQELLERYGSRGKIFNVHFRNVRGRIPKFQEAFLQARPVRHGRVLDLLSGMSLSDLRLGLPGCNHTPDQAISHPLSNFPVGIEIDQIRQFIRVDLEICLSRTRLWVLQDRPMSKKPYDNHLNSGRFPNLVTNTLKSCSCQIDMS